MSYTIHKKYIAQKYWFFLPYSTGLLVVKTVTMNYILLNHNDYFCIVVVK